MQQRYSLSFAATHASVVDLDDIVFLEDVIFLAGFSATAVLDLLPHSALGTIVWRACVDRTRKLWRCWHCMLVEFFGLMGCC